MTTKIEREYRKLLDEEHRTFVVMREASRRQNRRVKDEL